jgi:hypothetical protein
MSISGATDDHRISRAYQQVKRARVNGDYQAIMRWMTVVDRLLDERLARQITCPDTARRKASAAV